MDVDDPIAQANPAMPATPRKVLREVVTSLIHHHNSTHLEKVITDLDHSTESLNLTMFTLTVFGLFLAVVQALMSANTLSYENLFRVFGLVMAALIIPHVLLLMRQRRVTRSEGP